MSEPVVLCLDLEPRADLPPFRAPRWLPPGTRSASVKAASETVPADLSGFTHLILSGSTWSILDDRPELRAAEALVRQAVLRGVPVLGICYGHQLLARALLGRGHVGRAPVPEMGWLPIRWDESESGWFHPLPNPFRVFVGHHDEVRDLPEDWRVIARSGQCANHGMVNERLRVLGFQFHPEMDLETGNACYEADRDALTRGSSNAGRRRVGPRRPAALPCHGSGPPVAGTSGKGEKVRTSPGQT
ncbi:MAG: type 1 glutamine amidotransferase [Planctomycetes bacterium]|nr:type 1 glutamine amidotransferase [Planctomycetota bacterium]